MHGSTHPLRCIVSSLVLALLLAAPALGYTIYLKNSDTPLIAQKQYEVRGDRAHITLPNGTVTSIELAQIDVERTRRANESGEYGSALVLDDGKTQELSEVRQPQPRRRTLADLIQTGAAGPANTPGTEPRVTAPRASGRAGETRRAGTTPAGFVDLMALPRRPHPDPLLTRDLTETFRGQQLTGTRVYAGSAADRPLVEVTTSSETAVERALVVGALALAQLADRHPQSLSGIDLLMVTPDGDRGGQFQLTPELASLLTTRRMDVGTFFVRHVQF